MHLLIDKKMKLKKTSQISEKIQSKLDTKFDVTEAPAMQIQLGEEESEIEDEPQPVEFSTPLKIEEINEIYDREKGDILKIAMKLNQIDLESASEVADSENEAVIQEIINPAPGLVVDDDMNVDTQFSFQSSDLDTRFTLSNTLKARLDDILEDARKKIGSLKFPGEAVEDILRDLLYPRDPICFPQPSTDYEEDFEINIPESEMTVFKSPSLTFASIEKKELKTALNDIIEDLGLNLKQSLMSKSCKTETKQKITLIKDFNKRLDTIKKADIQKQLQSHEWLTELVEDQLKQNKTYYNFGENFENKVLKKTLKMLQLGKENYCN